MTASTWWALLGACLLISFTPGAGAVNTMTNALNVGFRRSIWGILGQQAALLVQLVIVAAGLGLVIAGSPTAFDVIRYCGAGYLVYLGVRQILADPSADDEGVESPADESGLSMFVRGLWVNLLNPKAIVFLLAFIPGFVVADGDLFAQYGLIGLTIVAVDMIVMWLFFALLGRAFARITSTPRARRRLNIAFGLLFIGVGVMLALM
ncbi:LysE family transporter [Gordonia sp. PDNC005]|uniref:LysE family transporter n=1 Tax=unclassified Gordonia (in: high G+C Gram-positive bacteria) TaxID=2657482 RepID=UPI0019647605|nr:LysE family transporter [Gordonia sp. PDNC005]QRY64244.1 LysE family transporter [Gordonia sp. PDNC005]